MKIAFFNSSFKTSQIYLFGKFHPFYCNSKFCMKVKIDLFQTFVTENNKYMYNQILESSYLHGSRLAGFNLTISGSLFSDVVRLIS